MPRILMFGCKNPREAVTAEVTLERDVLRGNSGNLLFSQAVYKSLSAPGTEIEVSDFTRLYRRASWVNRNFDHVVLPFANAFRPGFAPRLEQLTGLIEDLEVPVSVVGIGAQSTLDGDLDPLTELAPVVSRFMKSVLARSPSVGVRGEFTAHYLSTLGFGDVEVVGCPSMFMNGARLQVAGEVELDAGSRVAVTASRSDGPWMDALLRRTHASHPDLVYVAQGINDLELMLWGEPQGDDAGEYGVPRHLTHPLFREDKVRFFVDASPWIEHLRGVDFGFGTRIHGNVAALLAGTPSHVLAHDSRTLELARYFEIPHTRADEVTDSTDAAALLRASDYRALVGNHGERWERFVSFLDAHGLAHIQRDAAALARFDEELAQVSLAAPVRAVTAADNLEIAGRLHRLRRRERRLTERLNTRVAELEARLEALERTAPTPTPGHP